MERSTDLIWSETSGCILCSDTCTHALIPPRLALQNLKDRGSMGLRSGLTLLRELKWPIQVPTHPLSHCKNKREEEKVRWERRWQSLPLIPTGAVSSDSFKNPVRWNFQRKNRIWDTCNGLLEAPMEARKEKRSCLCVFLKEAFLHLRPTTLHSTPDM